LKPVPEKKVEQTILKEPVLKPNNEIQKKEVEIAQMEKPILKKVN
jgi:hypothetical protein